MGYQRGDSTAYRQGYHRYTRPPRRDLQRYARPQRYRPYYRPYYGYRPLPPAHYGPYPPYGYPVGPPLHRGGVHGSVSVGLPFLGVSLHF